MDLVAADPCRRNAHLLRKEARLRMTTMKLPQELSSQRIRPEISAWSRFGWSD